MRAKGPLLGLWFDHGGWEAVESFALMGNTPLTSCPPLQAHWYPQCPHHPPLPLACPQCPPGTHPGLADSTVDSVSQSPAQIHGYGLNLTSSTHRLKF